MIQEKRIDVDDKQIIEMYLKRDESALIETQLKYGSYCMHIAQNILSIHEDAEECVNDTWSASWSKIPPIVPISLKAFLGKLVRDIALSRYRANHAQKRCCAIEILFDELEECIPSNFDIEQNLEYQFVSDMINNWLLHLSKENRVLFIKRYYYGDSVKSLAEKFECNEKQMAQRMFKLRKKLKKYLVEKGVNV